MIFIFEQNLLMFSKVVTILHSYLQCVLILYTWVYTAASLAKAKTGHNTKIYQYGKAVLRGKFVAASTHIKK
jgi:hypothetical protein